MIDAETPVTVFQAVTLAIALFGSALGLLNLIIVLNEKKLNLRVTPSWGINDGPALICVEIINRSSFPVGIHEVGIQLPHQQKASILGWRDISFPVTIQPRMQLNLYHPVDELADVFNEKSKNVYIRTACGKKITGRSDAFKQMILRTRATGRPGF